MKKKTFFSGFLCAALLLLPGCLPQEETFESLPNHEQYAGTEFVTAVCEKRDILSQEPIQFKYVPVSTATLAFTVDGLNYDKFFCEAGDVVREGDLICQVDPGTLEKELEDYTTQIEAGETELANLKASREMALRIREKQDADLPYLERAQDLEKLNRDYDREELSITDRLSILQLKKENCEEKLQARRIYAPFDGVITYLIKPDVGEECAMNKKVCTISDTSILLFRGETAHWDYFSPGDPVTVINQKNGTEYSAEVISEKDLGLEPAVKTPGQKAMVYLSLKEPPMDLEENDPGIVNITLAQADQVLSVPARAVTEINGQTAVYIIDENGLRTYKDVTVGIRDKVNAEITDGLKEGDVVIIR